MKTPPGQPLGIDESGSAVAAVRYFADLATDFDRSATLPILRQRIVDAAKDTFRCDLAVLAHESPETKALTLDATSAGSDTNDGGQAVSLEDGLLWRCLETETAILHQADAPSVGKSAGKPAGPAAASSWTPDLDKQRARSAVGYPLRVGSGRPAVLALCSGQPNFFSPLAVQAGGVFAVHAMVALRGAVSRASAERSKRMLSASRDVGTAIGLLMSTRRIDQRKALNLLREASAVLGRDLPQLAQQVILTGVIPNARTRIA
jgi:hypothetical protein